MKEQKTLEVSQYALVHRPRTFDEVKGQANIVKEFKQRSTMNKFPSAMLFQGPTGTGKTTLAFLVAAAIQCGHTDEKGNPCGECESCRDIFEEKFSRGCTHMLDGSSSSKDDVIQRIEESVHTVPMHGPKHVFIIEEIDQLSTAAKNAFHKFLEKPSPYVHFILLSMTDANGNKVPQSIMDRCQPYHFKNIVEKDIAYALKGILEKEGLWADLPAEFKKEGLFMLVNNAKGSLRRAIQFLERAMIGEFFTIKDIEDNFKFLSETSTLGVLESILTGKAEKAVKGLEEMRKEGNIVDWVHIVAFFLLRHEQNVVSETAFDESPSSSLFKRIQKNTPEVYVKFYTRFMQLVEAIRHGPYMTNTHVNLQVLQMIKELHADKNPEKIPVRGKR